MWAYIQIARPDNWFKNIFILPGILLVFFFYPSSWSLSAVPGLLLAILATCIVTSSNYVLNELLDAEKDRQHPVKRFRPVPSGKVNVIIGYIEWIVLGIVGAGLGFIVNGRMGVCCLWLWVMGTIYNIPPVRTKDLPYLDVLTESVNNPLRMAIGWYSTGHDAPPPVSVLLAYWMFGAFLMATKRFAEYRRIGDPARAAAYRKSFAVYDENRLMESLFFYAALFGMFAGVFMVRYRLELVLATPLVAYALAYYLHLGFKPDSPVQYPERLYRQKKLMWIVGVAFSACTVLLFADVPWLEQALLPWHGE
jgi:4-hydroxybenzoate polyprenyltransferase